jgi:hypothetical protein
MSNIHTLVALFAHRPTLANAKKLVAKTVHNPMSVALLLANDLAHVRQAEIVVANAKDPSKVKEALQTELRARFKGMNIEVI